MLFTFFPSYFFRTLWCYEVAPEDSEEEVFTLQLCRPADPEVVLLLVDFSPASSFAETPLFQNSLFRDSSGP